MSQVRASCERELDAAPTLVFRFLSDYRDARPRILTGDFRDYRVERGGIGQGTVVTCRFASGRRERDLHLGVEVPDAGRTLRERDKGSSFVTTWSVAPAGDGGRSRVTVESKWNGAGGIGGFFERRFAPSGLGRVYGQMLDKLAVELEGARGG